VRHALIALALIASACSPDPIAPSSDAGRDAQLEADGGDDVDAGGPIDAGRDAGSDAAIADAGSDAGPPDGGPPDAGWGECSIVPQSGCMPGEACRRSESFGGPETGPPACEPAGPLEEGAACSTAGDDLCSPGLFCWVVCRRYCNTDADCPDRMGSPYRCVPETGDPDSLGVRYCARDFTGG
jgi:hypothetical protein